MEKTTQIYANRGKDEKENYCIREIHYSAIKIDETDTISIDESQKNYVEQKKPDTKDPLLPFVCCSRRGNTKL